MKILVCCNSDILAIPILQQLTQWEILEGICIPESSKDYLVPIFKHLKLGVDIFILQKYDWETQLEQIIIDRRIESVWVLTFPYIFSKAIIDTYPNKFINFHFGLLPQYPGSDPIFWQIKNKESYGGITVHYINEQIDGGPVILQKKLPIFLGETHGMHCQRIGQLGTRITNCVIEKLADKDFCPLSLQTSEIVNCKKPDSKILEVNWGHHTSEDIEFLVNASNPKYGGVKTRINNIDLFLLEVSPVELNQNLKATPGQIIHADTLYGLIVFCADHKCIRINIVKTIEGFLSGMKLFSMGIKNGQVFENPFSLLKTSN